MLIESFFLKTLGVSILKAAVTKAGFKTAVTTLGAAFDIHTIFESLHTVSTARDLGVMGLQIGYGNLSDLTVSYLVNNIGEDRFSIERQKSGLFVVNSQLTREPVFIANYSEFHSFSPSAFSQTIRHHKFAETQKKHVANHRPMNVIRNHKN